MNFNPFERKKAPAQEPLSIERNTPKYKEVLEAGASIIARGYETELWKAGLLDISGQDLDFDQLFKVRMNKALDALLISQTADMNNSREARKNLKAAIKETERNDVDDIVAKIATQRNPKSSLKGEYELDKFNFFSFLKYISKRPKEEQANFADDLLSQILSVERAKERNRTKY